MSDRWARPAADTHWGSFYTKINGNLQPVCPSASLGQELHEGQKLTPHCPKGMVKEKFYIWFRGFFSFLIAPSKGKPQVSLPLLYRELVKAETEAEI